MLDNLDLFDQSRFGASGDKLRPIGEKREDMINFEGFGLNFEEDKDQQGAGGVGGSGPSGEHKANKRAEKLRKEFEKLLLGTDTQIVKDAPRRTTQGKKVIQR